MALDSLERIAFAAVAMTAAAVGDAAGHELTFLAWRTLVVLGSTETPLRVSDLGERLGLSRPSTSKLIRRLERRGLVALEPDPDDGRALLVSLSDRGRSLRAAVVARRREILSEVVDEPLPRTLPDGLRAIAGRLDRWT